MRCHKCKSRWFHIHHQGGEATCETCGKNRRIKRAHICRMRVKKEDIV